MYFTDHHSEVFHRIRSDVILKSVLDISSIMLYILQKMFFLLAKLESCFERNYIV